MTDGKKTKKDLHREAYGAAMSGLRNAHPVEFATLRQEEATKRGLDWKPKPSERERAAEQLAQILSTFPDLANQSFDDAVNPEGPDADPIMPPDVVE